MSIRISPYKARAKAAGLFFLFIASSIAGINSLASAWEFTLKGESELRYRYISRTGPNDLFGNAPYAQAHNTGAPLRVESSIGLSGPNNKYVQVEAYSPKGSDAGFHETRLWLYPRIDVNRAVSMSGIVWLSGNLNGRYRQSWVDKERWYYEEGPPDFIARTWDSFVGSSTNWGTNPHYSGWLMPEARDVVSGVGMGVPVVQALWWTVQTPWGILSYGRRPAGFGLGWVVHERDTYATSLSLAVPYGPFHFVFSQYIHDTGQDTDPNDENNFQAYAAVAESPDPGLGGRLNNFPQLTPASSVDKNQVINWNQAIALIYRSGNLDTGIMVRIVRWGNVHSLSTWGNYSPGRARGTVFDDAIAPSLGGYFSKVEQTFASVFLGDFTDLDPAHFVRTPIYGDLFFLLATPYVRYASGRFFFNAEYSLQDVQVRRNGGRPISGRPQAWALETGAYFGPLKISLGNFYRSGHDRRNGNFNPVTKWGIPTFPGWGGYPASHDRWNFFLTRWGGGSAPIAPYTMLLGIYGTGNNSFNNAGNCTYQDFNAYAGRVDYALAANLNLFASAIHGERASNTGTPIGLYDGIFPGNRDRAIYPLITRYVFSPSQRPNVPDNDLGWELNVGFHWNLLENFTFKFQLSRWQPGAWFKWAYQDRSRYPYNTLAEQPYVNPERSIDALIGLETGFLIEF